MADTILEQIAALKDADWAVREEAALTLGGARDSRAVIPLLDLLTDSDRAVREAASGALRAIGEPSVVPLGRCLQKGDLTLQESATSILSAIADHRVIDSLLDVLGSPDWIVRMHAAKAMGRIGDPRAVDTLMPLLQDAVKAVREEAAHALVQIGTASLPRLLAALEHDEWLVRLHAVEALGQLRAPESVEPLLRVMFNDSDSAVRIDAARALGEIGDPRAVDFLISALRDRDIRPKAIEALGKIGDRRAVPVLLTVLTGANKPPDTRPLYGCGDRYDEEMFAADAAVKALGDLKDISTIPALIAALQNTMVREGAAAALVSFGAPSVPPLVKVLRSERDENIVYHVKESLQQLGWRPHRM